MGDFSPIGLFLRFQWWFVVDVLGFQIELCCRYFGLFDLATFGAIFENFGNFFSNLQVTLVNTHPGLTPKH